MTATAHVPTRRAAGRLPTRTRLGLLNGFELVSDGSLIALPLSAQRLVALLALHNRPLLRSFVAGTLWLDTSEERAHANLRSMLWRLHRCNGALVEVRGPQLRLAADIEVDLREVEALAHIALDDKVQGASSSPPRHSAAICCPTGTRTGC